MDVVALISKATASSALRVGLAAASMKAIPSGLELDLKATPVTGLLLVGGYSRLFGAWQDGDRIDVEQGKNAFSADVGYSLGDVTLDVSGFFRQRVALVPDQSRYFVLSSRVSYGFLDHLKLSVSGENLLDEQYYGLTSYNLPEGSPARGRTFYAMLHYNE
jgi:outer membrane receptor protein involved in Fe transport